MGGVRGKEQEAEMKAEVRKTLPYPYVIINKGFLSRFYHIIEI